MSLIDTHAHLTWDSFETDLNAVVQNALNAGVKTIINVGVDLESSQKAAQLKSPNPKVVFYSSIGLHPEEGFHLINESIHNNINRLGKIYKDNPKSVIAIGECGLDYYYKADLSSSIPLDNKVKAFQKKLFVAQIELAKQLSLPIIIHSRNSWEDIFLSELEGAAGVFHSFTGTQVEASKILSLGYYLGFTCVITYPKNEVLRQVIKETPLDKILTETDCPFLPPQSKRGQRNEPANVIEVVKVIAKVKNLPEEEIVKQVLQNANTLFKLPLE